MTRRRAPVEVQRRYERRVVLVLLVAIVGLFVYLKTNAPGEAAVAAGDQTAQSVQTPLRIREISALVRHNLVNAAVQRLALLDAADNDHPQVQAARAAIAQRGLEVARLYKDIRTRYRAGDFSGVAAPLRAALDLWADDPALARMAFEICRTADAGDAPPPACTALLPNSQLAPDVVLCEAGFAGLGRRTRAQCFDRLAGGGSGPRMVVIPPGRRFAAPFAIGRYEVSVGEFNVYCEATNACEVNGEDPPQQPLRNVSLERARAYLRWLSDQSGRAYHLPTAQQWRHAAHAEGLPRKHANNCDGAAPRSVTQGKRNPWGMLNLVGNVREWVDADGAVAVSGGSFADNAAACGVESRAAHDGRADPYTGLRVAAAIDSRQYTCNNDSERVEATRYRAADGDHRLKLSFNGGARYLDRANNGRSWSDGIYRWVADAAGATLSIDNLTIRQCTATAKAGA